VSASDPIPATRFGNLAVSDYIAALRREGEALATAADASGLDALVPTCPGWRMRDLVRHTSHVHRWATAHVGQRRVQPMDGAEEAALFGQWPDDPALTAWFRDGLAALAGTLEAADPNLACWSFLPAPSPLSFWARRQAHETAIHRADAQAAAGAIAGYTPDFAADGIDELLYGFVSRPRGRLRADPPRTLRIRASDREREWLVRVGPDRADVGDGRDATADCTVLGASSDLYLMLWNRRSTDGLAVSGDETLLALWRASVQIRWS
jgi:uncharacterized protein (TIGR03083 family)